MSCNQDCSEIVMMNKDILVVFFVVCYLAICFYFVGIAKKRDSGTILKMIFWGGFLLRAYYVLAAPYDITKHDIGYFAGFDTYETGDGHFGYIEYLYKNHSLPDFDPRTRWSFYNPPGFYIVEAFLLGFARLFRVNAPLCYEGLQAATLFFSTLTVQNSWRILQEFDISDRWALLLTSLLSVHPFYSIMAVTLNNDCMTMYFMSVVVLYTLRWMRSLELKHILVIALALGIAMFTKLSGAVLAFGVGAAFIYTFWKKHGEYRKFIGQFTAFLAVCFPIGMFSPIRNMLKFHMPLAYFQEMSIESGQYIPNQTLLSGFGIPSLKQVSYAFISFDTVVERNAWVQAMRTALFDEIMPGEGNRLFGACALILLWISILIAILFNLAFLWSIWKKNAMDTGKKVFLAVGYAAQLLSYVKVCLNQPFICTMNYRYIPVSMLFTLFSTAVWLQRRQEEREIGTMKFGQVFQNILICSIALFVIMAFAINMELIAWSDIAL